MHSGRDGRCVLENVGEFGLLATSSRAWTTCYVGLVGQGPPRTEPVVVVAPTCRVSGQVLDSNGRAVAKAHLALMEAEGLSASFNHDLNRSAFRRLFDCLTDDHGRFEIESAPAGWRGLFRVSAAGYGHQSFEATLREGALSSFVLDAGEQPGMVRGVVLAPDGSPACDARVSLGLQTVNTDAEGRFALRELIPGESPRYSRLWGVEEPLVVATHEHFQPGVAASVTPTESEELRVQLGPPTRTLSGRVEGPAGEPLADVEVWAYDVSLFSLVGVMNFTREWDAWVAVRSDSDGRFELRGVADHPYRIFALDREACVGALSPYFEPGTQDALIVLDPGERTRGLRGRVLPSDGGSLEAASVWLLATAQVGTLGDQSIDHPEVLERVDLDADGLFEFPECAPAESVNRRGWRRSALP